MIAQGEDKSATSQAGTLSDPALRRFGSFNGSVQRDGTALGTLVSAEITRGAGVRRILVHVHKRLEGGKGRGQALRFSGSSVRRRSRIHAPLLWCQGRR